MDELFIEPGEDVFRTRKYSGGPVQCIDGWVGPTTRAHLIRASGRAGEGHVEIVLECHAILRYTPCGVWIDRYEGEKFVNLRAENQWASTTEMEAVDQLYYRKRKQVKILEARLDEAKTVQAAMEKHLGKKPPPPPRPHYYGSEYDYY